MQVQGKGVESMAARAVHARTNRNMEKKYRRVSVTLRRTFKGSLDMNTISEGIKGIPKGEWEFNNTTRKWEDRTERRTVHVIIRVVGKAVEMDGTADSKADSKGQRT
jgi:hypothetical protein